MDGDAGGSWLLFAYAPVWLRTDVVGANPTLLGTGLRTSVPFPQHCWKQISPVNHLSEESAPGYDTARAGTGQHVNT